MEIVAEVAGVVEVVVGLIDPEPAGIICKKWDGCPHAELCKEECFDEDLVVNQYLEGAYAPEGIKAWWDRPRAQLGGQTPRQAWAAGERDKVKSLALSLVSSNGT